MNLDLLKAVVHGKECIVKYPPGCFEIQGFVQAIENVCMGLDNYEVSIRIQEAGTLQVTTQWLDINSPELTVEFV